jgi:hypothetical protein
VGQVLSSRVVNDVFGQAPGNGPRGVPVRVLSVTSTRLQVQENKHWHHISLALYTTWIQEGSCLPAQVQENKHHISSLHNTRRQLPARSESHWGVQVQVSLTRSTVPVTVPVSVTSTSRFSTRLIVVMTASVTHTISWNKRKLSDDRDALADPSTSILKTLQVCLNLY